jgi:hypothetical protein
VRSQRAILVLCMLLAMVGPAIAQEQLLWARLDKLMVLLSKGSMTEAKALLQESLPLLGKLTNKNERFAANLVVRTAEADLGNYEGASKATFDALEAMSAARPNKRISFEDYSKIRSEFADLLETKESDCTSAISLTSVNPLAGKALRACAERLARQQLGFDDALAYRTLNSGLGLSSSLGGSKLPTMQELLADKLNAPGTTGAELQKQLVLRQEILFFFDEKKNEAMLMNPLSKTTRRVSLGVVGAFGLKSNEYRPGAIWSLSKIDLPGKKPTQGVSVSCTGFDPTVGPAEKFVRQECSKTFVQNAEKVSRSALKVLGAKDNEVTFDVDLSKFGKAGHQLYCAQRAKGNWKIIKTSAVTNAAWQ